MVRTDSSLLDEFPQYPPQTNNLKISVIDPFCETLALVPNGSLTCIERISGYEVVSTDSPLLDHFTRYPAPTTP
jgi:hypothetical protein